jgi:predicted metal-dependent hydrolase
MPASSPFLMSLPRQIRLAAAQVPVHVRVSPRARRLALRIDAQSEAIELVLPRRISVSRALSFIDENRSWLEKRFSALPPRTLLADGASVPVLGAPHIVRRVESPRGRQHVWLEGGSIHVAAAPEQLAKKIIDFLKDMARRELQQRSAELARSIGREVGRVTVRDTTTRWGSCSANGNLAFSWRLVMAPEDVLHYVVAHEVAHLVEMNHRPRFWKLVEKMAPGADHARDWLNCHRARLLRIG